MPRRHAELFLIDILISVDSIARNMDDVSFDSFVSDERIFKTAMQDLTTIGEAARNLLDISSFDSGSDIEWRKIVDFRNIVVHEYFGIDYDHVYWIVKEKVPQLEKDILNLLKKQQDKATLLLAVSKMRTELAAINRQKSIVYLDKIEKILKGA